VRFEFEFGTTSFCFSFIFVSLGESRSLVSWCAGGRCGMACSDEDHGRSRRSGAEDRGWSYRSGTRWSCGREVGWRCVRSTPGMWRLGVRVSWLSLKTKVDSLSVVWPQNHLDGFSLVWPQNRWRRFVSDLTLKPAVIVSNGLASKPVVIVSSGLASKPVMIVSNGLASKPAATVFTGLASKLVATVFSSLTSKLVMTVSPSLASKPVVGFSVEPQNQGGGEFSSLGLKTSSSCLQIWDSKLP
jgi:hypothetical protein